MARDKQQAAQMRASQIRTLKMIYTRIGILDNSEHIGLIRDAINKQLASMGAETQAEYEIRREEFFKTNTSDKDYKEFCKPFGGKKKYKITDADVKRYNHW